MFGLFKRKPPEVVDLLRRIEAARQAVPAEIADLGTQILGALRRSVETKWKPSDIAAYTEQLRAGEKAEAFIYNFIVHATADRLESGHLHVYRGVLGPEGQRYKALFEHAITTMIAFGTYTEEWADTNLRRAVYKGIREMG